MSLVDFPIASRWPASDPSKLQLYSFPTPNGVKVSIMLEEIGLPYEAHTVTLSDADVKSAEFLSLNPNNKIPGIIDPDGPGGKPLGLWESGAILIYLAEKSGKLLPSDPARRAEVLQWVMFQMGGLGPMLGQMGFFVKFAGSEIEDPRPRARYVTEAKRLLGVIEGQLEGRDWITGDYSIADIAIAPWLRAIDFYGARDLVDWQAHPNCVAYLELFLARPAVQVGLVTPPREG
ncbi:glutathione S-transferase N-terminal domain-containing protein [Roseovarius sp. LXJ103]|uniref:glutathione S-transferase family protein n=1 Tax=Roseovarius carneus TaxID=2853164 RepID=UPI000D618D29|nr:glutathione S-transferase C-terminal domain-containing protein [Roseovarius carneus]MBZ8118349.1 glutathione S-transferase N-terminal domain-containing protein [Roseovarius carneus]PWE35937.1 glutathione S-transferase [Pelagicola sp. LXJ1103]